MSLHGGWSPNGVTYVTLVVILEEDLAVGLVLRDTLELRSSFVRRGFDRIMNERFLACHRLDPPRPLNSLIRYRGAIFSAAPRGLHQPEYLLPLSPSLQFENALSLFMATLARDKATWLEQASRPINRSTTPGLPVPSPELFSSLLGTSLCNLSDTLAFFVLSGRGLLWVRGPSARSTGRGGAVSFANQFACGFLRRSESKLSSSPF
jgi:hypothetical protein